MTFFLHSTSDIRCKKTTTPKMQSTSTDEQNISRAVGWEGCESLTGRHKWQSSVLNECCCHSNSGLQWNANDSKRVTYDYPLMDHSLLSYHHANVHLKCITNHHPGSISEATKTILSGSDWGVGGCHNNSLEWSNSNQRPNDWTRQEYCIFISELSRLLLHPCVKRPAADSLQGYTNNSLKFKQGA